MRARHLLLPLAVTTLTLTGCSSGNDSNSNTAKATTTTTVKPTAVQLKRGDAALQSAGGDATLDDATQQAVVNAAQQYVDIAVVSPLKSGALGAGYDALFDSTVGANATGPDRAALTDEGLTPVTGSPTITATPVRIDGLADRDAHVQLLATTFNVAVQGTTATGPLTINRTTELTYAPGPGGKWLITAYRVSVTRDTAAAATTTTAGAPQ
jgi:hypothetical protein